MVIERESRRIVGVHLVSVLAAEEWRRWSSANGFVHVAVVDVRDVYRLVTACKRKVA